MLAGSASALHEATGLNLTFGGGRQYQDSSDPTFYYLKAGWLADLIPLGKSAFSVDWGQYDDRNSGGDNGKSAGVVALQNIAGYGVELYTGFRVYDLDSDNGPSVSKIYVGTVGTRVKF